MHCRQHVVQVHQHRERFEALNAQVWIIGFAPERRARGWLQREEIGFPFLLDPEREVYQAYEIERSILRSWSPRNLWSYVEGLFQGKGLPKIQEDPNQLGADFVVDRRRMLRYTYYSQDPTYRPELEELLQALKEIESEGE